jgi:glycine/serine hydroxymethyltransferase
MKEPEMLLIAELITSVLNSPGSTRIIKQVRGRVKTLCQKFPVYENIKL